MARVPVSFIATDDPDLAEGFYSDVLGLTLRERTPYAVVFLDGDHLLRIQIVPGFQPVGHTVHGWLVNDVTQQVKKLGRKGVQFARFEHLSQDTLGIWTTPDGSQIAWFKDPSGNVLSLTSKSDSDPI